MKKLIAVCGSDSEDSKLSKKALEYAEKIGEYIAKKNAVLICGGHGGVMEAACRGAKKHNGLVIGIMPFTKEEANRYVDIAIPTKLGNMRNSIIVNTADVIIAIGGRWGTLNEISMAMIQRKPLVIIKGTGGCVDEIISGCLMNHIESTYTIAESPNDAIKKAFEFLED